MCMSFAQESQVLLTLTNPVENLTHVTLKECEEGDPDDTSSTAKVLQLLPSIDSGPYFDAVLEATLIVCSYK